MRTSGSTTHLVQYVRYLERLAQGDLGRSFATDEPVRKAIAARLPDDRAARVRGGGSSRLVVGVPLGLVAALNRGRIAIGRSSSSRCRGGRRRPSCSASYFSTSSPSSGYWFPLGGYGSFKHLVLPAFTLGVVGAAWYARMLRSAALNILSEDYVRMARSKGMPERIVIGRHVLRNAISPIVAMIGNRHRRLPRRRARHRARLRLARDRQQAWRAIRFNDVPW